MAKKGIIKGFFGSILNVRKLSSYDEVKSVATSITRSVKDLYNTDRSDVVRVESFSSAMQRLQLTEGDIKKRTNYFLYYFLVYFLMAIALLTYAVYLMIIGGAILAVMASLVLTVLMLVYSFREHFWYMQMKKRKIGCTVKEWIAFILGRTK